MRKFLVLLLLGLGFMLSAERAHAQEYTRRSFLVPPGHVELTGEPSRPQFLRIDVSRDGDHPVFFAPHVYFGVTRELTLGITHREGFCIVGCNDQRYRDVGFGLIYNFIQNADFELDLDAGLQARSIDPFNMGMKGGVLGRYTFSSVGLVFNPTLYLGFNHRREGNRDELVLPVWFYFQASRVVVPFVGTMIVAQLNGDGGVAVPVEGGVLFEVSEEVDLGAYFRFHNLLGSGANANGRELGMLARFRF